MQPRNSPAFRSVTKAADGRRNFGGNRLRWIDDPTIAQVGLDRSTAQRLDVGDAGVLPEMHHRIPHTERAFVAQDIGAQACGSSRAQQDGKRPETTLARLFHQLGVHALDRFPVLGSKRPDHQVIKERTFFSKAIRRIPDEAVGEVTGGEQDRISVLKLPMQPGAKTVELLERPAADPENDHRASGPRARQEVQGYDHAMIEVIVCRPAQAKAGLPRPLSSIAPCSQGRRWPRP